MNPKPPSRYDIREEPDGTWTVYDIFTGVAYAGNKMPASGLEREFAERFKNILNDAYRRRFGRLF